MNNKIFLVALVTNVVKLYNLKRRHTICHKHIKSRAGTALFIKKQYFFLVDVKSDLNLDV